MYTRLRDKMSVTPFDLPKTAIAEKSAIARIGNFTPFAAVTLTQLLLLLL